MILKDGTMVPLKSSTEESTTITHHPVITHPGTSTEEERSLKRNPALTPEQETLRVALEKEGIGSLYTRNNKQEFGKEYKGAQHKHGVYFQAETGTKDYKPGLWILDETITPKGLSHEKRPTILKPKRVQPTPTDLEVKKPEPVPPGAVGLTVRTNTARTNPQTGKVELSQGAANVAQTHLTQQAAPRVDTSESMPAVLPPPAPPPAPPPPPKRGPAKMPAVVPAA
jgi:hypothetical protein